MATVQKLRDISREELVKRAADLRLLIAEKAAGHEQDRRISQEMFDEVRNQDFSASINRRSSVAWNTIPPQPCDAFWNGRRQMRRPVGSAVWAWCISG